MTSVDNRIVQMDFDNKSFTKGVNQTVKDLDTLEKKLQFKDIGKAFSKIEALVGNIKFNSMIDSIESVNNKLSGMGVVAATVISRITNSAINMLSRVSSATIGTISSVGSNRALNLEQAMFQFAGLGMDVEATMADVSAAVDGTAYSLDAAAKVAAQLGASGMRAGDKMRRSLTAVSGVAAMAGSSYEEIGRIFTKVSGQGRLMGDDLLSLSSRGINAAATLAQQLGKTEAEVRKMVSKGEIDFQTFADAMDSAFGEHATKANETFTGAMSNVKAALGRIGAKFFTPFYQNARDVLNAIRPVINQISELLDPAFEVITSNMQKVSSIIQTYLGSIDLSGLSHAIEQVMQSLFTVFNIGEDTGAVLDPAFDVVTSAMKKLGDFIRKAFAEVDFAGIVQNFTRGVDQTVKAIRRVFDLGTDTAEAIDGGPLKVVYALKRVTNGLGNIFTSLVNIITPMVGAIKEAFPIDVIGIVTDLTLSFELLTQKFKIGEDSIESIKNGFLTFFNVVKSIATVVGSVLTGAFTILQPILSLVEKLIGYAVTAFGNLAGIIYDIMPPAQSFSDVIAIVADKIAGFISKITQGLPSVESFGTVVGSIKDKLKEFGSALSGSVPNALQAIGDGFKFVFEWAEKAIDSIGSFIKNIDWNSVFLGGAAAGGAIATGGILSKIIGFLDGLKNASQNVGGFLENLMGSLEALQGVLEAYQQNIQASAILKIAGAIGILAASLMLLSTIDPGQLAAGVTAMAALMGALTGMIAILNKINPVKLTGTAVTMLVLSSALLVLSAALRNLANLSWGEILSGSTALLVLSGVLVGLTAAMNAIKSRAIGGAASMVVIAAALLVLSQALKSLGSLEVGTVVQGIVTMTAALAVLTVALNFMKSAVGGAVSMVIISAALIVLAQALGILGALPIEQLVQGGVAIAAMLAALVLAVNLMSGGLAGAAAILIISASLAILSTVLQSLGGMDTESLIQGILGLVAVLGLFAGVSIILAQFAPQVLLVSVAFGIFAASMLVASAALVVMAVGLNLLLAAGLPALGMLALLGLALLPIVAVSPFLLIAGAGMVAFGLGLVAAGAGMLIFSAASPGTIANLALLAAAMVPLLAAAPIMLVVAAAMTALGVGSIALGGGLIVLSMGFTMLNSSLPAGVVGLQRLAEASVQVAPAAPLFAALGAALTVLGTGALVGGAGLLVLGVGLTLTSAGIALFSAAVSGSFSSAVEIFGKGMETFVWHTPGMLASGAALLVFGAGALMAGASALAAGAGFMLLSGGLMMFMNIYPSAESAFNNFAVISERLNSVTPILSSVGNSLMALSSGISGFGVGITVAASGTNSLAAGVLVLSTNLTTATNNTTSASSLISAAIAAMSSATQTSLTSMGNGYQQFAQRVSVSMSMVIVSMSSASTTMSAIMMSLVVSMGSAVSQIGNQFARIGPSVASGVNAAIPIATQAGRNIVFGCLNGMGSLMGAVYARGAEIGRAAVAGVNDGAGNASPSKKTFKSGVYIDQGAINGMKSLVGQVGATGNLVGRTAADSIADGFKKIDESSFSNAQFSPRLTPVMDLQQIQNASNLRKMAAYDGVGVRVNADYISGSVDNLTQVVSQNQESAMKTNAQLLSAINDLRSELNGLTDQPAPEFELNIDGTRVAKVMAKPLNREFRILSSRGGLV